MRLINLFLLFVILSSIVLAASVSDSKKISESHKNLSLDLKFNFTSFMDSQKGNVSAAKVLGGLVLAFLLITEVYFIRKSNAKQS
ncbi:hypothetical protein DRJ25_05320 [Candidatus Woesearchaeota archaeon]|nr:MAG: hypothetical protein DRJ25_05320 [Candidatus Woesearchaeota archaeon]